METLPVPDIELLGELLTDGEFEDDTVALELKRALSVADTLTVVDFDIRDEAEIVSVFACDRVMPLEKVVQLEED